MEHRTWQYFDKAVLLGYNFDMKITKCDICKKTIKDGSMNVHIGVGTSMFSNYKEICSDCGKPILKLLKDEKLIKNENKKHGK
jgi:hypothetical protein